MEQEIIFGIYSAATISFGYACNVLVQFMRRDKTESEADVNIGQSAKFWADAMDTMSNTAAKAISDMQELLRTQKKYLDELGEVQREVWALQGENQRSAEREKILTAQVETLMKSNLELKTGSVEKDKLIAAMQEQIATIPAMQEKISTLEMERVSLLETVDELSKRLEASEASGDNGQDDDLAVKTSAIAVKKEVQETVAAPTEAK